MKPNQITTIAAAVFSVPSVETKTRSASSPAPPELNVVVPEECSTLEEAVKKVHKDRLLTTIVVGEGYHEIDGNCLEIRTNVEVRHCGYSGVSAKKWCIHHIDHCQDDGTSQLFK